MMSFMQHFLFNCIVYGGNMGQAAAATKSIIIFIIIAKMTMFATTASTTTTTMLMVFSILMISPNASHYTRSEQSDIQKNNKFLNPQVDDTTEDTSLALYHQFRQVEPSAKDSEIKLLDWSTLVNNNNDGNKTLELFGTITSKRRKLNGKKRIKRATQMSHEIRRCSMQTFEKCLAMMQEVMQNRSLAFPTNIEELEVTCRKLKSGDYCAERYIRSCVGDRQRLLYQDIVQGTKNVIRLICQQGETQRQYLEYASCFKDIFESEAKCSKVLGRFQDISQLLSADTPQHQQSIQQSTSMAAASQSDRFSGQQTVERQTNVEEKLKQFCCAYRDLVNCQLKNVRDFCGTNGLHFFERYMSEMTNSLINEHCIGYTYSNKCNLYQKEDGEINNEFGGGSGGSGGSGVHLHETIIINSTVVHSKGPQIPNRAGHVNSISVVSSASSSVHRHYHHNRLSINDSLLLHTITTTTILLFAMLLPIMVPFIYTKIIVQFYHHHHHWW